MYNDKKAVGKKGSRNSGAGVKSINSSAVPKTYYNRINSNRSVTTHHPVLEALNDILVVKGGRVFVKER